MAQWEASIDLFMEWPKETDAPGWAFADRTLKAIGATRKDAISALGDRVVKAVQGDLFTLHNFVYPAAKEKDIHVASVDLASLKAVRGYGGSISA